MSKRLLKEFAALQKSPIAFCRFEIVNDDIHHWRAFLTGPPKTPYAGGTFVINFHFPAQYPFKPPKITFATKIYHPNVSLESGEICNDVVNENWGPTLNVRSCAEILKEMMENPQPDHPLEESIANQMRDKPKEFEKAATKFTKQHAT